MNVTKILLEFDPEKENILPALQKINSAFGYVNEEYARQVADYFSVPESRIWEISSFYDLINTKKPAELVIRICSSANCSVNNSREIISEIENFFRIKAGSESHPKVKLEEASCFGLCGEGPVVVVNGKIFTRVTVSSVHEILKEYI